MSFFAAELINRALRDAGYQGVSTADIGSPETAANKCYYQALKAIARLTKKTPDWGWNEPESSVTASSGDTLSINTRANPNYIHTVTVGPEKTVLARTSYHKLIYEIYPRYSTPSSVTGDPTHWYVDNRVLKIWPPLAREWTFKYKYQNLPQTFAASAVATTVLDIGDELMDLLVDMTMWRFEKIIKDPDWEKDYFRIEDPANSENDLYEAIENDKLLEKWSLQRIDYAPAYNLGRFS